jgi:hypothetical protein
VKKIAVSIGAMVIAGMGAAMGEATEPLSNKDAKPTLGERLTNYTVKGTLMSIEGEYLWVKDIGGRDVRLHVDQRTKLDKVEAGDKIKAYVTTEGHTTTVQRE